MEYCPDRTLPDLRDDLWSNFIDEVAQLDAIFQVVGKPSLKGLLIGQSCEVILRGQQVRLRRLALVCALRDQM